MPSLWTSLQLSLSYLFDGMSAKVLAAVLIKLLFSYCLGLEGFSRVLDTHRHHSSRFKCVLLSVACLLIHLTGSFLRTENFNKVLPPWYPFRTWIRGDALLFQRPVVGQRQRQWAHGHHTDDTDRTFQDLRSLRLREDILLTFLTVVTKYKKQLKGEGFILAHDLRVDFCVMGKGR